MFDPPSPLFGQVASRVGVLLACGAGAILLLNALTSRGRAAASAMSERQTRAQASLWPRFWVWVIGTSLLLAGAGTGPLGFGILLALLSIQAVREVAGALRARGMAVSILFLAIVSPIVVLSGPHWSALGMMAGAIAAAVLTPTVLILARGGDTRWLSGLAAAIATLGYVAVPLAVLVGTLGQSNGFAIVSWLLIVIVLSDTFAMFGGLALGRRQMASRLSPGKTIEGVAAGFAGALAGAAIMRFAFPGTTAAAYYGAAFGVGAAGLAGDLFASALKRTAGLKDFSRFLPGHGGLMDRLDSILLGVIALVLLERLGVFG